MKVFKKKLLKKFFLNKTPEKSFFSINNVHQKNLKNKKIKKKYAKKKISPINFYSKYNLKKNSKIFLYKLFLTDLKTKQM